MSRDPAFISIRGRLIGDTFSFSRVYSLYKERSAAHVTATVLTVTTLREFSLSSHNRFVSTDDLITDSSSLDSF